jgi:hypothetical protein
MQTILFGLASALFWGTGDFAGGLVSRKVNAIRATLYVQAGGFLPVILVALFTKQLDMPLVDWFGAARLASLARSVFSPCTAPSPADRCPLPRQLQRSHPQACQPSLAPFGMAFHLY